MEKLTKRDSSFYPSTYLELDEFSSLVVERFYKDNENITFQFRHEINQSWSEFDLDYLNLIKFRDFLDGIIQEAYGEL
jgi:hypothetical protein